MTSLQQGKIGNRIHFKQEGTGYPEEVTNHLISGPCGKQIGKAVKDVKCPFSLSCNHLVYACSENLKAPMSVEFINSQIAGTNVQQGFVFGKTQVDDFSVMFKGCLNERGNEKLVIVEII